MAADILELSKVKFDGDFDEQVRNILESVRLTRTQVENLKSLFYDLEQTLQSYWPGCIVMPFGSIVTGLGIKSSDTDCYVFLPEYLKSPGECFVMTAKRVLRRRSAIFQQLFAITAAKVPIVKFFHGPTKCHCDVNFQSPSGVRNSNLIAFFLQMDKRALPLAVLIKYWSKVHKLTGTNLVPNYALTLMTIFYLQVNDILPSVLSLQQDIDPDMVDNWNTSFNENYQYDTNNHNSLYNLLGGFFEYYSTYQYSELIISPYTGYSIDRSIFKRIDNVPNEFELYKDNFVRHICKKLQIESPMCVQDPFEHSRNSSVAVHPKLFTRLTCYIKFAAEKFRNCNQNDFLQAILDPRNAPHIPAAVAVKPRPPVQNRPPVKNIPNRPNRVTKHKHRNTYSMKNMSLHSLYNEANRIRKNARQPHNRH